MWKPDYASSDELAAYVRVYDQVDAVPMAEAVASASRAIDHYTGRQFGQLAAPAARYYTPWFDKVLRRWVADIDDLMDSTGLQVALGDGTGAYPTTVTGSQLRPLNAAGNGLPWTVLVLPGTSCTDVQATARWGWSAVPDPIKAATLLQASRFLARRDSPYGIAGSPPRRDSGSGMSVAAQQMKIIFRCDPDIEAQLEPFRRDWWFQ